MNKAEQASMAFQQGQSCSQAILSAYGPAYGLTPEQALGLGSSFSGGMAMAETCGAVTGALMVLGLDRCSNPAAAQGPGRAEAKDAVLKFAEAFKAKNGSLLCRELLSCDISDPKGLALAREKGLFRTICPKFVKDAAEILNELLPPKP
jgi:C_GCAxxG_C_C family probable redox protein